MLGISGSAKPGFSIFWYLDKWTVTVMAFGILFASSIPSNVVSILQKKINDKIFVSLKYLLLLVILYLSILRIVSGTYNPFIYFQF